MLNVSHSLSVEESSVDVRPVNRRVASGAVTTSQSQVGRVVRLPDVDLTRRPGRLRVATETEVIVAVQEELGVDRTMRLMANRAAFAQGLVLEDHRARLLAMALRARLVQARHATGGARAESSAMEACMISAPCGSWHCTQFMRCSRTG